MLTYAYGEQLLRRQGGRSKRIGQVLLHSLLLILLPTQFTGTTVQIVTCEALRGRNSHAMLPHTIRVGHIIESIDGQSVRGLCKNAVQVLGLPNFTRFPSAKLQIFTPEELRARASRRLWYSVYCFSSTKVQILTPEELRARAPRRLWYSCTCFLVQKYKY
jgi:hypothetical protein